MSSIVKKSSHFTPKLKKNAIRKKNQLAPATPPATQATPETSSQPEAASGDVSHKDNQSEDHKLQPPQSPPQSQPSLDGKLDDNQTITETPTEAPTEAPAHSPPKTQPQASPPKTQPQASPPKTQPQAPLSPPKTQPQDAAQSSVSSVQSSVSPVATKSRPDVPNFNFTLPNQPKASAELANATAKTPIAEPHHEDIDPMDVSRGRTTTETAPESKPDHDVFKKPESRNHSVSSMRRRSSARPPQRRLSGISQSLMKPRSDSISIVTGALDETEPIKIGIPMARPSKRRRSSLASFSKKRPSFIGTPVPAVIELPSDNGPQNLSNRETTPELMQQEDSYLADDPENEIDDDSEFVVGIDIKTKKLKKFRRRTEENKDEIVTSEMLKDENYVPVAPEYLPRRLTSIKQLPRAINDEADAKLFSQITISSDSMTMADLCKPLLPIGTISGDFEKAQAAQAIIKKRKDERRKARQIARERRISWEEAVRLTSDENEKDRIKKQQEKQKALNEFMNEAEPESSSLNRIQLNISDGKINYNEESTVVNKHANMRQRADEIYEENPFENPIIGSSYAKRQYTDKWTADEMLTFYNALSTWGTDFTFIAQLFPYRNRKQVKARFLAEEKSHPEIVELALRRRLPPDFEKYCRDSKRNIDTMEAYEAKLKELREEHEQHMEEITREKENAMKADLEASRKREIEIRTGSKPMTRQERMKQLRANETVVGSIDDVKKKKEVDED